MIATTLQELAPDKKIKQKFKVFSKNMAMIGARFSELYSKTFNKPCSLSKTMVKVGTFPGFYSNIKARNELGFIPQKSFKDGVIDAFNYLKEHNLLGKKGREKYQYCC